MVRYLLSACALSLLVTGPAFAVGANCEDQLAAIKSQLSQKPDARASIDAKYQEAQRLCSEKKDMEAQDLVRQIQEQMTQNTGTDAGAASGSSKPPSAGAPRTDTK
jgi:hypothetical protein